MRAFTILCVALVATGLVSAQDGLEEAQGLLAEKKWEAARDKFDVILESHPDSVAARLGMARACWMLGESEMANFHALKAEKLEPENLEAIELTGLTFRAVGDLKIANGGDPTGSFEEAIASFTRASKKDAENASFFGNLGYLNYMLSRFKESAAAYDKASKLAPKDANLPYQAARSHEQAQQWDEGVAAIDRSIALAPDYGWSYMIRGNLLFGKGDKNGAAESYATALAKGMGNDSNNAAAALRACYADEQNWKALIDKYKVWTVAQPRNAFAHWWHGNAQYLANEYDSAIKTYGKAQKVWGKPWAETTFRIGQCLEGKKDWDKAAKHYVKAFNQSNADSGHSWTSEQEEPVYRLRFIYGTLFGQQNFEKAVEIAEKHVLPIISAGKRYEILQDIGFFCRDWGLAIERSKPSDAKKLYEKSRKFYEDAVAHFSSAEGATNTQKAQIQNDTGLIYHYHYDDLKTATKHYKKALQYDPTFGDVILNYGRVLVRLGKYEEAIDLLETGPKDRPDIQRVLREARNRLRDK